jgi:trigger factor
MFFCRSHGWRLDELFDTDTEMTETATTAVATETVSSLERRIDMTVMLADIEKDVDQRLKQMSRTVKMAGFRPGKVPMKMVAQQYGSQARSEAIGAAVEKTYGEKVREQNLRVAGYPRIEPKADAVEGQLGFTAIFEVYPEISLGDVSGEAIEKPTLTVTEAEVDKTLDVLRKQRTTYSETERASETGDRLVIDFIGRKNGEEFQGGKASDYTVMVGGGMMLPDFETQLVGVKAGDHKNFDVAFPADYQAAELAGNTVQFEMTVKKVEAPQLPEIDGEFARQLGVADGDTTKMRAEVRANLEREVKKRLLAKVKEQVMDALLKVNPIEVPKALIDDGSRADGRSRPARHGAARHDDEEHSGRGVVVHRPGRAPRQAGPDLAELVKAERPARQARAGARASSTSSPRPSRTPRKWCAGTIPNRSVWPRPRRWRWRTTWSNWVLAKARVSEAPIAFDD